MLVEFQILGDLDVVSKGRTIKRQESIDSHVLNKGEEDVVEKEEVEETRHFTDYYFIRFYATLIY